MRRPGDRDHGASTVEYAALIVLAAALIVGIVSTGLPARIGGGVGTAICRIFDGTNCGPRNGGRSDGSQPNGGSPTPTSSNPGGRAPITLPNILNGAGSYLASTTAGVGDFFHNLGPNLVKGLRWIVPGPDPEKIKNDKGPKHGWRGFWHGFWHGFWDLSLKPVAQELLGAGKEIVDQIVGIGDLLKLAWCGDTVIRHCSKKDTQDAQNTYKYIHDHPRDALKQVGKSLIEPCTKAYGKRDYEQDGRCAAAIITTIVGAEGLTKLGKLGKLGKLAGKVGKLGKAGKAAKLAELWKNARRARDLEVRARELEHTAKKDPTAANKTAAANARKAAGDAWKRARSGARAYRSPKKGTPEYQKRYDELSKDPAHGGKANYNSKREAEIGLDFERRGKLPGPIQRSPLGKQPDGGTLDNGEFFDRNGKAWDVKGFKDKFPPYSKKNPGQIMPKGQPGRYDRTEAKGVIQNEINDGKNVILDSRDLSPTARADLDSLVKSEPGWKGKVIWYP